MNTTPDLANREIVNTREFNVSRERLWEAITDPKQVAQWWGPRGFTSTIKTMDVQPGGRWLLTMHGPGGTDYHNESIFTEVAKPDKLVYTHLGPIHEFQMTMLLADCQGKSVLMWRMQFPTAEEVAKLRGFIHDANEQNFDRLTEHLAK